MAYCKVEPFGEYRQDLRFAKLWCLLANAHRDRQQQPTPFMVKDFMDMFEEAELPDEDELMQKLDNNLKRLT